MVANIVSRFLAVLIGNDNQDWSTAVATFVPGRDSLGEAGVIANTATLTLLQDAVTNPESLDPWLNPARWRPGNPVQVLVHNSAQSFVNHPQGHLYILSEPAFDRISGQLTLELGCWLAWADSQEPADDVSAITLGTSTDLSVVCQRYLEAAGIPSANISLDGPWGYAVAYPIPKPSGSFVALAGAIAYASGFRYLYTDRSGIVRAAQLSTDTTAASLTVTLGANEVRYDDLPDPQEPAELIRVVGSGFETSEVPTPQTDLESDGDSSTFTRESYSLTPVTIGGVECVQRQTRVTFEQDGGLVMEFAESPGSKAVVDDTTETRFYEIGDGPPYLLKRVVRTTDKARGILDPRTGNDFPERATRVVIDYFRDDTGRITSIVEEEDAAEVIYDRVSASPFNDRTVRRKTQRWKEVGTDQFQYFEEEKLARIAWQGNVGANGGNPWFLTQARPAIFRPATGKGENAPPTTDDWEGPFTQSEQTYKGEAEWVHRGGASGRQRKRVFQLPEGLALSNGQCAEIAELLRDLLAGRKRGKLIQIPITDTLLAIDTPVFRLDVIDGDRVYQFLTDVLTWEHQRDRAFVECAGILIGDPLFPRLRGSSIVFAMVIPDATLFASGVVVVMVEPIVIDCVVNSPSIAVSLPVEPILFEVAVEEAVLKGTQLLAPNSIVFEVTVEDGAFKEVTLLPVAPIPFEVAVEDGALFSSGVATMPVEPIVLEVGIEEATLAPTSVVVVPVEPILFEVAVEDGVLSEVIQITFVDASIDADGSFEATKVIDAPANINGDLLIAFVSTEESDITPPAGWTLVNDYFTLGIGGRESTGRVYTKTANNEPAQYSWINSSNGRLVIALLSFRGASGIANAVVNTGAGSAISVTGAGGFNVYLATWVFTNSTETATITGAGVSAIQSPTNGVSTNRFVGGYSAIGTTVNITHTNGATVLAPNIGAIALELI